jgi:ribonuclease HI
MHCEDAEEVEAKAALDGIKIASNLGYTKIILELDNSSAAKALRSQEPNISKQWSKYEEAKKNLKAFQDHTIILVKRDCNSCADALAKHARTCGVSFLIDITPIL